MICNDWYFMRDPYNSANKRNINNTDKMDYNCGGYALGTFSWYMPCKPEDIDDYYLDLLDTCDYTELYDYAVSNMLKEFPKLHLSTQEIVMNQQYDAEKYYAIAFRYSETLDAEESSYGRDFHFAKQAKNGIWYHKRGCAEHIDRMNKVDLLKDWWNGTLVYNLPIVFFLMER